MSKQNAIGNQLIEGIRFDTLMARIHDMITGKLEPGQVAAYFFIDEEGNYRLCRVGGDYIYFQITSLINSVKPLDIFTYKLGGENGKTLMDCALDAKPMRVDVIGKILANKNYHLGNWTRKSPNILHFAAMSRNSEAAKRVLHELGKGAIERLVAEKYNAKTPWDYINSLGVLREFKQACANEGIKDDALTGIDQKVKERNLKVKLAIRNESTKAAKMLKYTGYSAIIGFLVGAVIYALSGLLAISPGFLAILPFPFYVLSAIIMVTTIVIAVGIGLAAASYSFNKAVEEINKTADIEIASMKDLTPIEPGQDHGKSGGGKGAAISTKKDPKEENELQKSADFMNGTEIQNNIISEPRSQYADYSLTNSDNMNSLPKTDDNKIQYPDAHLDPNKTPSVLPEDNLASQSPQYPDLQNRNLYGWEGVQPFTSALPKPTKVEDPNLQPPFSQAPSHKK